jgi:micrococcal nuclease
MTRSLFVLQGAGLLLVLLLRQFALHIPALFVSILTLTLFAASLFWLYSRYRSLPLVRQKVELERLYRRFAKNVLSEENVILASIHERERLMEAEQEEIEQAKSTPQKDRIGEKYQALQEKNGSAESKARASRELLQYELVRFKPRLEHLAHLTFPAYLRGALAAEGTPAGLLVMLLIGLQMVSTLSVTGLLTASPPPATPTTAQLALAPSPIPPTAVPTLAFTPTIAILPPTAPATDTVIPANTPTLQATLPAGLALCLPQNSQRETGLVVGVVDGDTIDVQIGGQAGGQTVRVRYIGMDTPEQDEMFYQEATAYNQSLVLNKTVTLIKDTSELDSFHRLLRYVVVENTFVNETLVAMGFARATAFQPDTACISTFEAAQRQAQTARAGVWLSTPVAFLAPVTGGEATGSCDPSYPGVCILPAPPDLDCGDIPFDRFQVLQPDPHGFDGDQDGVGCE